MQTIIEGLTPYLIEFLATLLTGVIAFVSARFARTQAAIKAKTGLDIERIMRETLHQAMTTGAQVAIKDGKSGVGAVNAAIDHAKKSVPDALDYLGPTADVLTNLAKAKLAQVLNPK